MGHGGSRALVGHGRRHPGHVHVGEDLFAREGHRILVAWLRPRARCGLGLVSLLASGERELEDSVAEIVGSVIDPFRLEIGQRADGHAQVEVHNRLGDNRSLEVGV